jgi:putative membrane-bound dehydrogenase-like protein
MTSVNWSILQLVACFYAISLIALADDRFLPPAPQPRPLGTLPSAPGPRSPEDERASFHIVEGFKVELVASEPAIVDPVAMCFDARGRLFVCEMRGYPNGGVGTGNETRGKIKCLRDRDGDGRFETVSTFAEGLRFPMGITPYREGVIVAVAPDVIYLEDSNQDDKADKSQVLYTGFNLANIQQMVNSLQWGLDNWIYGCAGSDGGTIRSLERPDSPPVLLGNRGFRFKPDQPASLEPTSGGGQYGLTADDYQHWFTATNSQHLRQIVLPAHYLKRNPALPVSAVTVDIPEHGPAAKVFRISPFEPWRLERTMRRAGGPDAIRFPKTELMPGGFFTSACSPLIYTGDLFPKEFYGNNFVCDPANNLIHRELLQDNGAIFRAVRAYPDREFLASEDNWFRPVHLSIGPDGAMYVLDFYREVIETPLSLPEDIKKQLNLESRGRGRIWRIAPTHFKPSRLPDLSHYSVGELVHQLTHANSWRRLTAQRLLIEGKRTDAEENIRQQLAALSKTAIENASPAQNAGWVNLLWTLHGLGKLTAEDLEPALRGGTGVRENALRLSEPYLSSSQKLREVFKKAGSTPRVRFQLALSAGFLPPEDAALVLHEILKQDANDSWTITAALSSAAECGVLLAVKLASEARPDLTTLSRVAAMIGARAQNNEIASVLKLTLSSNIQAGANIALLDGLGRGMQSQRTSLATWLSQPPPGAVEVARLVRNQFEYSVEVLKNPQASTSDRLQAARLLAYAPFEDAHLALASALTPSTPIDVQLAAINSLSRHSDKRVAEVFLKELKTYGPTARTAVLDALLSRADHTLALLAAMEQGKVPPSVLAPAQIQQLKQHPNSNVKSKALTLFKQTVDFDRANVIRAYSEALKLKGDPKSGQAVFRKYCSACHQLDGIGHDVGANLLATLGNKSGEDLLIALFDPNREVDPRYVTYQVGTTDERILSGIVVAESPSSITLRRSEGLEDVILRKDLSFFRSTALSLMPVGFEKELKPQDVADLLAYLRMPRN